MSEESSRCDQTTLPGMGKCIGSLAKAAGRSLCASPPGPRIIPCGQARALVSPSVAPVDDSALTIRATSGLFGTASSRSAALSYALASRLRERLSGLGSIVYAYRWRISATPSHRSFYQLRASGPTIGATVSIGLLRERLAGWQTVTARASSSGRKPSGQPNLEGEAKLAGWATVRTLSGGPESAARKKELRRMESGGGDLQAMALLAGWTTVHAGASKKESKPYAQGGKPLSYLAGLTSTSSGAETGPIGALNPALARWLMGFPTGWARLPDTETP